MGKKVLICVAAGTAALAVITGIIVLVAHVLNYRSPSHSDVWEDYDDEEEWE